MELCQEYKVYEKYKIICKDVEKVKVSKEYDVVVLGGGSLLSIKRIDFIYEQMNLGSRIFIWGSGCDYFDKESLKALTENNKLIKVYPDNINKIIYNISNKCEFFGVRGPLTYNALQNCTNNFNKIIISGDVGFLLKEKNLNNDIPIKGINDDSKIVAVNWGTSKNNIYGQNEKNIEDNLVKICKYLLNNNYIVYLYKMRTKDTDSILQLYKRVGPHRNLILDTNLYSGGELLSILKKCFFSINFKLHGNVISATANTPFICLGYRSKCFDFVQSIGCDKLIVSTDELNIYSEVICRTEYIVNNYDEIKTTMQNHINDYRIKLLSPFVNNLF